MHKVRRRNVTRLPPVSNPKETDDNTGGATIKDKLVKYGRRSFDALFDPRCCTCGFLAVLWACSLAISVAVIYNVPYTEIDWLAYMQEVEGFLNGTFDYYKLKGDTGPLVYPAGFVYLYSILYKVTDRGSLIFVAQSIFVGIYAALLAAVYSIYHRKVAPFMVLLATFTAYRVTSIFMLRMFNDGVTMLFYYCSIALMLRNRWNIGAILYSLAVSVKMNILLSAPGLLIYLLMSRTLLDTTKFLGICASVQVLLGLPFLITSPTHYIERAFDLRRVFMYQWTVNWRFLPEPIFLDGRFHILLLVGHVSTLALLTLFRWRHTRSIFQHKKDKTYRMQAKKALIDSMCESNLVGICFARSLHYQFYVWYYHSLPILLRGRNDSHIRSLAKTVPVLLILEACWIFYPPNALSSLTMLFCHIWICFLTFRKTFAE